MSLQYTIVGTEDGSNITVFIQGQAPLVAHSSHPNYAKIVEGVMAQDESVSALFDVAETAATKFERLTERVTVANGRLYFDGVEVANALATQVVRFLDAGVEDWKPLVNFFENVQQNPQEYSREQLYNWLQTEDFTITPNGMIVGYKGVQKKGDDDGVWLSINSGKAIVDGEVHSGRIPNKIGSVVEMPRNEVTFDPDNGCSTGLHVGTYSYANSFGRGGLLEVHVNPRDVVSVPNDSSFQKMRVCRYTVVDTIEKPYTEPVADDYWYDEDEDEWGDGDEFGDHQDDYYPGSDGELTYDPNWPEGEDDELLEEAPRAPFGGTAVHETEDGQAVFSIGDRFADTDARRSGNVFTIEFVDEDNGVATGKWSPSGLTRTIAFDRLLSRKYRKVS